MSEGEGASACSCVSAALVEVLRRTTAADVGSKQTNVLTLHDMSPSLQQHPAPLPHVSLLSSSQT